ncbi:MAG TPA: hypothetical protein VFV80_00185 [Geminicoccaceae bacterium]|nr:hypothetical protein [Geminicoccaceae bacterium]
MENISRVLKVFVIAGGVALLGGSVLLVVLILTRPSADPAAPPETAARAENPDAAVGAPSAPRLCELALPAPGTAMGVPLPAGARIEQVVPSGGCLILLGVDGAGRQFVALVDPYTGARLSLLLMRPAP